MDSNKQSLEIIYGFGMATVFWIFAMLLLACLAYDHGKYIGKLESTASLATEKEAEQ